MTSCGMTIKMRRSIDFRVIDRKTLDSFPSSLWIWRWDNRKQMGRCLIKQCMIAVLHIVY